MSVAPWIVCSALTAARRLDQIRASNLDAIAGLGNPVDSFTLNTVTMGEGVYGNPIAGRIFLSYCDGD